MMTDKTKRATQAKLDRSDRRIELNDDHTTRRWQIEFASRLKSFFHEQRDAAAARVTAITARAEKIGNNADTVVQSALAFDWSDLIEAAEEPLFESFRAGIVRGLAQAGVVDHPDPDDWARSHALVRAAEMAGMKWVDGELVENPKTKWSISHTIRNEIWRLVTGAFQEKTLITELGEKIRQAASFSDAHAEAIAAWEIDRAENCGAFEAGRAGYPEMTPGKGREVALLYNLPGEYRFAIEAVYELTTLKERRLVEHLCSLEETLAEAARSGPLGPKTRHQLDRVLMVLLEGVAALYALTDLRRKDRFDIVERWRQESLQLPVRPRGIGPRIKLSSDKEETYQRLADPWLYTPALAQVLFEGNWINAMKETDYPGPTQHVGQRGVNAYICGSATKLLEYRRINEDKEYIEARESGHQLISLSDIVCPGEEVERIGVEEIPDDLSSKAKVIDYATMPGPKKLRIALQMLHEGYKEAEVAKAIGTDGKHLRQTIRRVVEQMGPAQAKALEDWISYREFYSAPYAIELSSIVSKLRNRRIQKLALAQTQRPDPTRANATGQTGMHRQVRMK